MTLFAHLRESRDVPADTGAAASAASRVSAGPFAFRVDGAAVELAFVPPWSAAAPRTLWSHAFGSTDALERFLDDAREGEGGPDPLLVAFWGRRLIAFGPAALGAQAAAAEEAVRERIAREEAEREATERRRRVVDLYATAKGGWYRLELQRASERRPDWTIAFRGRAERERLLDYLRWRKPWFAEYLDHAAEHGHAALEERLTREMFEMEARVKASGMGAGGARPLRMWRGQP